MRLFFFILLLCAFCANIYASSNFSGERLKIAAYDYLRESLGDDAEITIAQKIENQQFDEKNVQAEFISDIKSLRGSCNINLEFKTNGKLLRRVSIPVKVRIYKSIPLAVQSLSPNSKIKSEDIILQKYDVTDYSESEFLDKELIIGKSLEKFVAKGRPILKSSLSKEYAIKRGALVNLIVQSGAIQIIAQGRAQNSGLPGDEIKVIRDGSNGIIQGIADINGSVIIGAVK